MGGLLQVSSFKEAHHPGPPPPPQRTEFDSNFQFGVPQGDVPAFCLTTSVENVTVRPLGFDLALGLGFRV